VVRFRVRQAFLDNQLQHLLRREGGAKNRGVEFADKLVLLRVSPNVRKHILQVTQDLEMHLFDSAEGRHGMASAEAKGALYLGKGENPVEVDIVSGDWN
jgi:hypothetical protein